MPRKKLTIAQQLEVVKEAKELYLNEDFYAGMCPCFTTALQKLFRIKTGNEFVREYLPFFTHSKMVRLGQLGVIAKVTGIWLYWDHIDRSIRPIVFDYLIKELEKQL